MCFHRIDKHKVADAPIKCYKVMNLFLHDDSSLELESLYHPCGKRYRIGDVMVPELYMPACVIDKMSLVESGVIHSFGLKALKKQYERGNIKGIRVCVECEIPKGEVYWHNKNSGTYISKSLVIKSII